MPVAQRHPAQSINFGIVPATGQHYLGMTVVYRSTGAPQAIPTEKEILSLRLPSPCPLCPFPSNINIINNLFSGKTKGIKFVKNHQAVHSVILGDIAGSNTVLSYYPAKEVFGGIVLWVFKQIVFTGMGKLGIDASVCLSFNGARASQPIK